MARGSSSGGRIGGGSFGGSRSGGGRIGGSLFGGGRSGGSGGSIFGGSSRRTSGGGGGLLGGGGFSGFPGGGGMFRGNRDGGGFNDRRYDQPSGGNIGGGFGRGPGLGGCGCGVLIAVLIIVVIFVILISVGTGSFTTNNGGENDITKSTITREALPKGSVNETDYYTDGLGVINNRTTLLNGMKYFYNETGVQPYLYITDSIGDYTFDPSMEELQNFTNNLYGELFSDEAHLLFVYLEFEDSYMTYYISGTQAKSVIDTEAGDILLDYMDRYYYDDSLSYEEFFSKAFSDTADRIMTVTRSPWIPVLIVLALLALAALLFVWWMRAKKQKNLEAQQTEDILNIPLEKFGTTEAEELAKKYEQKEPEDKL